MNIPKLACFGKLYHIFWLKTSEIRKTGVLRAFLEIFPRLMTSPGRGISKFFNEYLHSIYLLDLATCYGEKVKM